MADSVAYLTLEQVTHYSKPWVSDSGCKQALNDFTQQYCKMSYFNQDFQRKSLWYPEFTANYMMNHKRKQFQNYEIDPDF